MKGERYIQWRRWCNVSDKHICAISRRNVSFRFIVSRLDLIHT